MGSFLGGFVLPLLLLTGMLLQLSLESFYFFFFLFICTIIYSCLFVIGRLFVVSELDFTISTLLLN